MRRRTGEYHPAVDDLAAESRPANGLAFGVLLVFVVIATPVPWRPICDVTHWI